MNNIKNPLLGESDAGIRLEMQIRTSLNEVWASTADNLNDTLLYCARQKGTRHVCSLHMDRDTTFDQQQAVIFPVNISDIKEI